MAMTCKNYQEQPSCRVPKVNLRHVSKYVLGFVPAGRPLAILSRIR